MRYIQGKQIAIGTVKNRMGIVQDHSRNIECKLKTFRVQLFRMTNTRGAPEGTPDNYTDTPQEDLKITDIARQKSPFML